MEPGTYRGDILYLDNNPEPFRVGDIAVFQFSSRDIPIVHRVIQVHDREDGSFDVLTKGDNNEIDDRNGLIYPQGLIWLNSKHLIGKAKAYYYYYCYLKIINFVILTIVLVCIISFVSEFLDFCHILEWLRSL